MGNPSLPPDFRDFLRCLASQKVEYLLVGAYAVAHHGHPRATADIDIWIRRSPENARRIWPSRVHTTIDGVAVEIVGLDDLLANKRAAGRHKDLDDLDHLGGKPN